MAAVEESYFSQKEETKNFRIKNCDEETRGIRKIVTFVMH